MIKKEYQEMIMEGLGVFALCFVGGWAVEWAIEGKQSVTAVALAHGFVLGLFVFVAATISGGHLNPAVSFSLYATGYQKIEDTIRYVLAQCGGSLLAGLALKLMRPKLFEATIDAKQLGHPALPDNVDTSIGFVCEAIATGTLVLCVMSAGIHKKSSEATVATMVGASLLIGLLSIGNTTGAALNPARVFGPSFFSGRMVGRGALVYYFGPIVGGISSALLYKFFFMSDDEKKAVDNTLEKPFVDN